MRAGFRLQPWRRFVQAGFLLLFCFLVLSGRYETAPAPGSEPSLRYPVQWFLQVDPLVSVAHALANRALYEGLLWSLCVIVPTIFFGRWFCGWVCPLGTLNHWVSSLPAEARRGRRRVETNRYQKWQRWKYLVLGLVLGSAALGTQWWMALDPISLLTRTLALSILPALHQSLAMLADPLVRADAWLLQLLGLGLGYLGDVLLSGPRQPYFQQAPILALTLGAILLANLWFTRFWCRGLCPLGALLGLLARWSVFGLEKRIERCDDCHRCLLHCQGGDEPQPGVAWRKTECVYCFNCLEGCPQGTIAFTWFPRGEVQEKPDWNRRRVVTSLALGAGLVPILRANPVVGTERNDRLIRPPGALDERSFLERCIRCGACMRVCPNNALQPAILEGGLEGLWTPVLVPRIGYCEPSCTLCSQVCPTGAIWKLTSQDKGWASPKPGQQPVRIGTAFYDRGRCLPWAMATECIVCEEWCPTSPKAIYLQEAEVRDAHGRVRLVRLPYVDPSRCVGCGACEYACPVHDRPAIYVTSVGETRSRVNQLMLEHPRSEGRAS